MKCPNCEVENDTDSKFCKECGQKLFLTGHRSLKSEEHIKIGELIYAAYKHKEAGEIESAILACQGALALNDMNAPAHALLGSLYELKGDILTATKEYEYAAKLDPNNDTYRQKLETLRRGLLHDKPELQKTSLVDKLIPYWPILAGVATVCLVLLISLTMIIGQDKKSDSSQASSPNVSPQVGSPQIIPGQPYWQPQYPVTGHQNSNQQPYQNYTPPPTSNANPAQHSQSSLRTHSQASNSSGRSNEHSLEPLPTSNTTQDSSRSQPVIVPVIEERPSDASTTSTPSPTVSAPRSEATGTTKDSSRPSLSLAGDPEQRAMKLQQEGKYKEAIAAYEESLNSTSDPGRVYQQMALCYQRDNQPDKAIENYKKAINSYLDQRRAGRDPAEVQRNIRACENGIRASQSLKNKEKL